MTRRLARDAVRLGLVLLVFGLAAAEDRRTIADEGASAIVGRALRAPGSTAPGPFLRSVHWVDVGPLGTFEGWADTVSRRPRHTGLFTLLSYYDLVAANVRVRADHAGDSGRPARGDDGQATFQHVQESGRALRAMVRDDAPVERGSTVVLTRTFLGAVVMEGFALEAARGPRGGTLRCRLMTSADAAAGWSLQDVEVEAADGRRLAMARATWKKDGTLEAIGPYTLTRGRITRTAAAGRFAIHVGDALTFRRLPAARPSLFLGVPVTAPWPVPTAVPIDGAGSSATAHLTEQLLRVLPIQTADRRDPVR